ncbi:MAG: DUF4011 domain-containing protein [Methanomassiliicoccales archaeon]|nr:MAG: DUF4011 domain-containing protein [Methanomassiliicoccales archaeon]
MGEMAEQGATIDRKIADWESKLIDMSLKNRLLNYKLTKSGTIVLKHPEMRRIFEDIVLEKKVMYLQCEKMRDDFLEDQSGGRECDLHNDLGLTDDRLLPSTLNPNTERVLKNLRSRSALFQRERGINALYITFGSLIWKDDKDDVHLAPLLLAPIKISKKGLVAPYSIQMSDGDLVLNPALVLKVRREMGVELPPAPEDLTGFDLLKYLDSLASALMRRTGWNVQIGAPMIGLFMFAKIVIYNDMKVCNQQIKEHPLLRALAGDLSKVPRLDDGQTNLDPDPLRSFNVLEADSSQQEAVDAVMRGESMVLIGPPGTGKSQTIANIISNSLASGKTVLFVAEKMAALEVVKRRLDACGLGDFCLELHSGNPGKQDVLESMMRPLEMQPPVVDGQDEFKLNQLRNVMEDLRSYFNALHTPQGGLAMTPFSVYSELASLYGHPQLLFDVREPLDMTQERLDRAEGAITRLISLKTVVTQQDSHPWRDCDLKDLGPAEQSDLLVRLQDVAEEIARLRGIAESFCPKAGLPVPTSLDAYRKFASLMSAAGASPLPPKNWFLKGEASRLLDIAMRLLTAKDEVSSTESQLLSRYKREFLDFDGAAYAERFEGRYRSFLRMFNRSYRKDMQALRSLSIVGKIGYREAKNDVLTLRKYQRAKALLDDVDVHGEEWFGRYNKDLWMDSGPMISALRWTKAFIEMPGYDDRWTSSVAEGAELREDVVRDGPAALKAMRELDLALGSARNMFADGLRGLDGSTDIDKVMRFATEHVAASSKLSEWVELRRAERTLRNEGLGALFDEVVKRRPEMSDLKAMFRRRLFQLWLQELHSKDAVLGRFSSSEHMEKVSRYKQLDKESISVARARVRSILYSRLREMRMSSDDKWRSEEGYLNGLRGMKRRPTVREMLARCPTVIRVAKPCLMMSPITVSQFLAPPVNGPQFDVVIFDEASQVVPEDAVCCIARGRQIVIVGDNRQLPPTRFFDRLVEMNGEGELEDLESILDACGTIGLRQKMLLWHYRSRQEPLISFSNRTLYDGKLFTMPSADPGKHGEGIELIYVKDGVYDRGGRRDNGIEAGVVADMVIEQFLSHPDLSLGVVAFSQAQQEAIEDRLEYKVKTMIKENPDLGRLFDEDVPEPFFVKNLENVQGDERDVMIFSVGYGKDDKGVMTMNFGPLNQEGGARRLNVAITRARRSVKVVSSIRSSDIQVGRDGPAGVVLLKEYLDHAESRGAKTMPPKGSALPQSKLEESIAEALEARGYHVVRSIGTSSMKVDLGVKDPSKEGRFLLGILCDGASYKAGRSVRDREIVREAVLNNLGWRTVRVWSRDWALERERTLERLEEAIRAAQHETRSDLL